MTKVAAIQIRSSDKVADNLWSASQLIVRAVEQRAQLILLPENFAFMGANEQDKLAIAEPFSNGVIQDFLSEQSLQHKVWIIGGTIPLQASTIGKVYAACLLYNPRGMCTARYDKIHLFDVCVDNNTGESYCESSTLQAGNEIVIAKTPLGNIGMSVCYDVRFPELYRNMHQEAVEIIAVPSAFTATTGLAHWESLLRARAIENLCYVIASNQGRRHTRNKDNWGHSMIISPWGEILDCVEEDEGVAIADIDIQRQAILRGDFPCLEHCKLDYKKT